MPHRSVLPSSSAHGPTPPETGFFHRSELFLMGGIAVGFMFTIGAVLTGDQELGKLILVEGTITGLMAITLLGSLMTRHPEVD